MCTGERSWHWSWFGSCVLFQLSLSPPAPSLAVSLHHPLRDSLLGVSRVRTVSPCSLKAEEHPKILLLPWTAGTPCQGGTKGEAADPTQPIDGHLPFLLGIQTSSWEYKPPPAEKLPAQSSSGLMRYPCAPTLPAQTPRGDKEPLTKPGLYLSQPCCSQGPARALVLRWVPGAPFFPRYKAVEV